MTAAYPHMWRVRVVRPEWFGRRCRIVIHPGARSGSRLIEFDNGERVITLGAYLRRYNVVKVITLTQPWATLIAIGAKHIETRGWGTRYRGPIAIHAAKGLDPVGGVGGLLQLCATPPFAEVLAQHGLRPGELPRGAVVCAAALVGCDTMTPASIARVDQPERSFGFYEPGRYAWRLQNTYRLARPYPIRGRLGLGDLEPDAAEDIRRLILEGAPAGATA